MTHNTSTGPLSGVTVLSLAEQLPGPFATLLLADLGANVVLIERPGSGDPARTIPAFFAAMARNKRSMTLDLKNPVDKAKFMELAEQADVVFEGYSPGVAARLGIGYEDLKAINPGLVYASISGFGQTGPYRDRAGHDVSYQGVAGLLSDQAKVPGLAPEFPLADIAGAMFAALAVVSALHGRQRTGIGSYVDVSLTESLAAWMTPLLGPLMNDNGRKLSITHSPAYGAFSCADGGVLTLSIVHEDHFWRALCGVLDLPELADIAYAGRIKQLASLRERVAERIATAALPQWATRFDAARVPWSPVHAAEDVCKDPHFIARGLFAQMADATGALQQVMLHPVQFSAYPRIEPTPAPGLGQHNGELLRN